MDDWVKTEDGYYLPIRGPDGQQLLKRQASVWAVAALADVSLSGHHVTISLSGKKPSGGDDPLGERRGGAEHCCKVGSAGPRRTREPPQEI